MSNNRIFGGTGLDRQAATNILIRVIGAIKEHHIKIDGKRISNHKMIEWLTCTVTEEAVKKSFRDSLKRHYNGIPTAPQIYGIMLYDHFCAGKEVTRSEPETRRIMSFIVKNVVAPIEEHIEKRTPIGIAMEEIDQWMIEDLIACVKTGAIIEESDGTIRHILDARPFSDEEAKANTEIIEALNQHDEYRQQYRIALANGFRAICQEQVAKHRKNYDLVIDWYLSDRGMLQDQRLSKRALNAIKQTCEKSNLAKEAFQNYYERHGDQFQEAFMWHPELKFVDDGHIHIYYDFDELRKAYGITMQDKAEIRGIFPPGQRLSTGLGAGGTGGSGSKRFNYVSNVLDALEKASAKIKHKVMPIDGGQRKYFLVDIYPETVNGFRKVRRHGDYFAIVFYFKDQWWILVDSYKQGSAIYLWRGDNKDVGLNLINKPKGYVKRQAGIFHRNHTLNTRSIYESYELVLSDAGGVDVLR